MHCLQSHHSLSNWTSIQPSAHSGIQSKDRALAAVTSKFPRPEIVVNGISSSAGLERLLCSHLVSYELVKLYLLDTNSIETMLPATPQLATLSCFGYGRFIQARDDSNTDRLPLIKKLALMSVSWKYMAQYSVNLWNWTQITHLELRYMGVDNFLKDVLPEHLVQLQTLVVIGSPFHH